MIFHIDANSFYAACERLFRPDLDGKPIAVLSNNDGITIALSQECKNLGFKRGDAYFKMRHLYDLHKVAVFSSNYTLYADISMRLNMIYNQYCDCGELEIYSIDESFLFFPNWKNGEFTNLAHQIRTTVYQQTHIWVSVGIAPTKTLAKLCNKLAKKQGGVCNWQELDAEKELSAIPASDIWGVGYSKTRLLCRYNIKTAADLKRFPLDKAKKYLTITGMRTVQELNEVPALNTLDAEKRKNIGTSRSFATGVTKLSELETALCEYAQLAVTRMRQEQSACRYITVYLMTARAYKAEDAENVYFNGSTAELPMPTSYLPDIIATAVTLLRALYRGGYSYRKVMINLLGLTPDTQPQPDLFDTQTPETIKRKQAIMNACDKLNAKFGRGFLHTGIRNQTTEIQKNGEEAAWKMKRAFLSPHYTTRFSDLPEVF